MNKNVGDIIELQQQDAKVVTCNKCGAKMVWVRPSQLKEGDLVTLKRLGLKMTNAATFDQVCINCELVREEKEHEQKKKVSTWFNDTSSSHHDSDGGFFGGGGGFGGFGGGGFSGGGASGGW